MEITKELKDNLAVLRLKGRLDTNTAADLDAEIKNITQNNDVSLIIDLKDLQYISSAGLRVMLMTARIFEKAQGKLVLANMNSFVRNVFDLAGFSPLFNIADNFEDALQLI